MEKRERSYIVGGNRSWYSHYGSTVVLKKTLESPLDSKEIKLVNPKGNQP